MDDDNEITPRTVFLKETTTPVSDPYPFQSRRYPNVPNSVEHHFHLVSRREPPQLVNSGFGDPNITPLGGPLSYDDYFGPQVAYSAVNSSYVSPSSLPPIIPEDSTPYHRTFNAHLAAITELPNFIEGPNGERFPYIPCPEGLFLDQPPETPPSDLRVSTIDSSLNTSPGPPSSTTSFPDHTHSPSFGHFIHISPQNQSSLNGITCEAPQWQNYTSQIDLAHSPASSAAESSSNPRNQIICPFDSSVMTATTEAISAHKDVCTDPDVQAIPREPRTHRRGNRIQVINKVTIYCPDKHNRPECRKKYQSFYGWINHLLKNHQAREGSTS